jgi:hypothetical protein
MSAKARRFRSIGKLGPALVGLLALNILLAAVMVVFRFSEVGLLQRLARGELVSADDAARSDNRVAAFAITSFVVLTITGIVWLVWQHRSQANLHVARLRELEYTPGWSVGWWLIPFANLVKPFQTVRELWKASSGDESWWQNTTWSLIGWWWALWIATLVLERVASAVFTGASTLDSLISSSRLYLAYEVVVIIATILAIAIVRAVNQRQAGLAQVVADRTSVPTRPDVPYGNEGQNP